LPTWGNDLNIDELRRLERFCLEQAEEAGTPEGRAALQSLAADYRAAAGQRP
jgi:Spy/CpxP family protein refolding chaperone